MTSFSKFPILQLPCVALANVFRNFDFCAMLMFLINYPKIRHLQLISPKFGEYYAILVDTKPRFPRICLVSSKISQNGGHKSTTLVAVHGPVASSEYKDLGAFNIEGHKGNCIKSKPCVDNINPYHTYWDNEKIGVKVLVGLLCDMYRIEVQYMRIRKSTMWTLNWLKSIQVAPLKLLVVDEGLPYSFTMEVLERISKNSGCKVDYVVFSALSWLDPKIDYTPGSFKGLEFKYCDWLTVDILLSLGETCQELTFGDSQLNLLDMKEIIEHWLAGRMKSIKFLRISVRGFWRNRQQFFESIRMYARILPGKKYYERVNGAMYQFDGGVAYEREDGGFMKMKMVPDSDILMLFFFTER